MVYNGFIVICVVTPNPSKAVCGASVGKIKLFKEKVAVAIGKWNH